MLEGSLRFNLLLTLPALILTVLLVAVTGMLSPSFLTEANLANLATRLLPLGLVALGQALVLFAGRIDLSVGSIMSLATAMMALTSASLGWLSIPLTLAAGVVCGLFTAAGVNMLRINPLVMGLATAAVVKGITLLVLPSPGGEVDYALYDVLFGSERLLALPLLLAILAYAIFVLAMGWTRFGRSIYAFGSDPRAAFANGVSSWKVDLSVYGLSGFFAAAAGIVLSIRILSGDPLIGESYTLDAVSAAILGGVALQGGRGNLIGVFFAAVSLVLVNNMFNLLDLNTNLQDIAKGLIFVLALVFFMRGKAGEA
ncbi:ABC transporter permease [Rhizobium sp.]